ncbi:MAG: hypothetical protein Q9191_007585 [Dirinaria sp. TL-2023a]
MATGHETPILIGVGDFKNESTKIADAIEPMQLMLQASLRALEDATSVPSLKEGLQSKIDSVNVVRTWTWPYADLPGLLSGRLGIRPKHSVYSEQGGNQPVKLLDEAARRISCGESRVALITGGEALASRKDLAPTDDQELICRLLSSQRMQNCAEATESLDQARSTPVCILAQSWHGTVDIGAAHSIGLPIHVYPLYENAFRAHRKQTIEQNHMESARLYADFAKIAKRNEYAWSSGQAAASENEIATVTTKNRMICFPYPLLMNAFNNVNLAASCILTSVKYARELGIPESKWIYPRGGAGTQDSDNCKYLILEHRKSPLTENSLGTPKLPFKPSHLTLTRCLSPSLRPDT